MRYTILKGGYQPTRAHKDDAGIDFRTPIGFTLNAHESKVIDLKIAVQIPLGYFGKMESKSGLNVNHNIQCTGGVIDSGFRGSIKVRMTNNGDEPYTFQQGDKLVQMVLIPVALADLDEVPMLDNSPFGRNENGWGSTGK